MNIVVPVSADMHTVFKRTGQAPFFAVFENEEFIEFVPNEHGHGDHGAHNHHDEHQHHEHDSGHSHRKDIKKINNCDIILAQAVGPHMKEALEEASIKIQKLSKSDGADAQEVVQNFLAGKLKSQQKESAS